MAEDSNIKQEYQTARGGMNMDSSVNQIQKGQVSYGLNAVVENFDANSINYQNEPGAPPCLEFPTGYALVGKHFIPEQSKHIFLLANPSTGDSEVGYMTNNDCVYRTYINAVCLNFNVDYPIHKIVHKITNCTTEIYWPDQNGRRFLDLTNPPYKTKPGTNVCDLDTLPEIDCNKIKVQPNFAIPTIEVGETVNGGNLIAGTVQFAIQYSDAAGNPYTSYYSVTNPLSIADPRITTPNFNYPVGKSVPITISNIDITGYFQYFNLAVIKTINNIPSVELIGTFFIDNTTKTIIYNGQNQTQIRLTIDDIFERFPSYEIADDVTTVQDVLVWKGLTSIDRINYQQIANKITLQWETWRLPNTEDYSSAVNTANLRGYLRDEVYPYEIMFLLTGGKQTDGFHIPGRAISFAELSHPDVLSTDPDFIGVPDPATNALPYWQVYNTGSVSGTNPEYTPYSDFKGSYQWGEFAYWESSETYPCNEDVWGELAGQPIRHHKFPDVRVSPIFENPVIELAGDGTYTNLAMQKNAIFPIGVRINISQVQALIANSNLTQAQKDSIVGFKILRGNRDVNKSIVAKGLLRNVGKYTREGTDYYFPNYPYNDLREDPFLLAQSNAYNSICLTYSVTSTGDGEFQYTDCFTNELVSQTMTSGEEFEICSISTPLVLSGSATIDVLSFDQYYITVGGVTGVSKVIFLYTDINGNGASIAVRAGFPQTIQVDAGTPVVPAPFSGDDYTIVQINSNTNTACYPDRLSAFETDDSRYRFTFNSPETSFGQPFLGSVLKLESAIFGAGKAHFTEVKNNALYKLITKEAQEDALRTSEDLGDITSDFSGTAMFTAYQAYLQIYINGITRKNYAYSYNSIAGYDYYANIDNDLGIKQRNIDLKQYLTATVQNVGDDLSINNYQRETAVYVKTTEDTTALPLPPNTPSLLIGSSVNKIIDRSRFKSSEIDCTTPEKEFDISTVSYYASIKDWIPNQWGQIYSYETIDTGFQVIFDNIDPLLPSDRTVFGGDTFICKFAFKTKLPFFIDNRVGAPDDSDIFYDEIGNVAYPEHWHSARSILYDYDPNASGVQVLKNIISIKAHNFDCPNNQLPAPDPSTTPPTVNPNRTFYDGKFYLFAYGIPSFYCESSVNVDLRQAFNDREGDFWPHVSTGIPDDWLQQSKVPIVQDNTYYYNVTYSKQNKENFFTHLPVDWESQLCFTNFPFRAISSERQQSFDDNKINSWLIYRPSSFFDFPQNYGKFTSIDGIENRQVLARFENKSLLYNALYTTQTNTRGQVYLGQSLFSVDVPPLDYAETDIGYIGSQHKFLLKIPQGQITVDAKRGQIFLIQGNNVKDISASGSGVNRFLKDHLPFEILKHFPDVNIDNNFKNLGLHGVYDSKYNRIIITKLDYIPLSSDVKYDAETQEFYIENIIYQYPTTTTTTTGGTTTTTTTIAPIITRTIVYVTDGDYFCNKSWTLSFNFNTNSWISFHSYLPNFYISENNFFYSGLNEGCDLDIQAMEIVPSTTTTSTTGTPFDCELEGYAVEETTTTTSTSTSTTTTSTSTSTSTSTTTSTTTVAFESFSVRLSNALVSHCSETPVTVYTPFGGSIFTGQTVYFNSSLSTPVTGFIFIDEVLSGTIYNLDDLTGLILSDSGNSC